MKITYDHDVDALYIRFKETTVTTKHVAEGIAADYDADGYLAGIEILDAIKRLGDPTVFKQIILEDIALVLQRNFTLVDAVTLSDACDGRHRPRGSAAASRR